MGGSSQAMGAWKRHGPTMEEAGTIVQVEVVIYTRWGPQGI